MLDLGLGCDALNNCFVYQSFSYKFDCSLCSVLRFWERSDFIVGQEFFHSLLEFAPHLATISLGDYRGFKKVSNVLFILCASKATIRVLDMEWNSFSPFGCLLILGRGNPISPHQILMFTSRMSEDLIKYKSKCETDMPGGGSSTVDP